MSTKRKSLSGIQYSRSKPSSLGSRKQKPQKSPSGSRRGMKSDRKGWKYVLLIILVGAFLKLAWWGGNEAWLAGERWLSGTSWAILKHVEVVGLSRLPEHDIIMAAAVRDRADHFHL